jgi:hypothetical protein
MQKRSVQLPLHFRLSALFRVKPTCEPTCLSRHLPSLAVGLVASRFPQCVKPKVFWERRKGVLVRAGR